MGKAILGIDIGGAYATAYLLGTESTFEIQYTKPDLEALCSLDFDTVILEPTGGYERVVSEYLEAKEKRVRVVKLNRLSAYRKMLGIPKSDANDARILAQYGDVFESDPLAWVMPCPFPEQKDLLLQKDQLLKQRSSLVNRLRGRLAFEFPEYQRSRTGKLQNIRLGRPWGESTHSLLIWLSGDTIFRQASWDKRLEESCGTGITEYTRHLAFSIAEIDREAGAIEKSIEQFFRGDRFRLYHTVFDRFAFPQYLRCYLLCRIYPIQRYLVNGGQCIYTPHTTKRGRLIQRNASLSAFKAAVGCGTIPNSSGIRGEKQPLYWQGRSRRKEAPEEYPVGDRNIRRGLFLWVRVFSTGKLSCHYKPMLDAYWSKKRSTQNFYQASGNLSGYAMKLTFFDLVNQVQGVISNASQDF
ncbi:MAG: transposase [Cyanobacteria bacterium J06638_20]